MPQRWEFRLIFKFIFTLVQAKKKKRIAKLSQPASCSFQRRWYSDTWYIYGFCITMKFF